MNSCQAVQFPSRTGAGTIQARIYRPDPLESSSGLLVQIIHGMAEHMARYDEFCRYLADQGIAVCIHDLPGHGRSVTAADKLGYFGADDAYRRVPLDIDELARITLDHLNGLPGGRKKWRRVLLGHSMGSMISRLYIAKPDPQLSGVILSATAGSQMLKLIPGEILARLSVRRNGPFYPDEFLAKLTAGGFLNRIPQPRTPVDWLSRDQAVVEAYVADPLCGFTFTAAGYQDLCGWVRSVTGRRWAARVPAGLPVYLFAGLEDPVSNYGQGSRQVNRWLTGTGHPVTMKLYPDCRHETLNELNKTEVWQDIVSWLETLPAGGNGPAGKGTA